MDIDIYNELFNFFRAVAFQKYPDLAVDKKKCEDIFHDYFLSRIIISPTDSRQSICQVLSGVTKPEEVRNLLYTTFLNAIRDYFRVQQGYEQKLEFREPTGSEEEQAVQNNLINKDIIRTDRQVERLTKLADKIFNELERDERVILSLIYIEGQRYEDLARELHISKSAADRKEKALRNTLRRILGEIDHEDFIIAMELLLEKIKGEDNNVQ